MAADDLSFHAEPAVARKGAEVWKFPLLRDKFYNGLLTHGFDASRLDVHVGDGKEMRTPIAVFEDQLHDISFMDFEGRILGPIHSDKSQVVRHLGFQGERFSLSD